MIESVKRQVEPVLTQLTSDRKLTQMFRKCFFSTIETTTELLEDGTTFVFTGDIPAMWLRDSTAQVAHYIPFSQDNTYLQRMIEGLIERQIMYILIDPYANAFNKQPNGAGHRDIPETSPWVWERKYETDSLCYPIDLAYRYWKQTDNRKVFSKRFKEALETIVELWEREQDHMNSSDYYFLRTDCPPSDTLSHQGVGSPVGWTGMIWSGFRPSDDACVYGYNIPGNMYAVVVLGHIMEISLAIYADGGLHRRAHSLRTQIEKGIHTFGIIDHPRYGRIFAYETDGLGNHLFMDDANVPSLLSIPYIGYLAKDDPLYLRTRACILSEENPYYYAGTYAQGVGSPHTPERYIWHIGLIMQALTALDSDEAESMLKMILQTDAGTGLMHEGFDCDDPKNYTREWFAWANSLFSEFVMNMVSNIPDYSGDTEYTDSLKGVKNEKRIEESSIV